jgi:hypothetical protein
MQLCPGKICPIVHVEYNIGGVQAPVNVAYIFVTPLFDKAYWTQI